MPHISLQPGLPGIRSLAAYRADTGRLLYELAEALLRAESSLAPAERELIAALVSSLNDCTFCAGSHAAAARCLLGSRSEIVDEVLADHTTAPVSEKLRALLVIASKVQKSGRLVTEDDVAAARHEGATDREIHDAVLIAAAFSMYNRYVDGLATLTPVDPEAYAEMGRRMAEEGYAGRFRGLVNSK